MNSNVGSVSKVENILSSSEKDGRESYRQIIDLTLTRFEQLTATMLQNYPNLQSWDKKNIVFQKASLKLFRRLHDYKPDSTRDYFAHAMLQLRTTLIELATEDLIPQANTSEPTGNSSGPATLEQWVTYHRAIDKLPEPVQEVFSLTWYAAAANKDVASLMELSEEAVQRYHYKARLLLANTTDSSSTGS